MRWPTTFAFLLVLLAIVAVEPVTGHGSSEWRQGPAGVWHHASREAPKIKPISQHKALREESGKATLKALPRVINNGDKVEVTWANIQEWSTEDFIGVYSPPDSSDTEYIDYAYVSEQDFDASTAAESGNGSFSFRLLNIRNNYTFRYFRAADDHQHSYASSNIVRFRNPNEPTQGHLQLTGDPTQMRVMWVSNSTDTPMVEYWRAVGDANHTTATGISKSYTARMMCGSIASIVSPQNFIDPGQIHDVLLQGLETDTVYKYRYGNPLTGWSEPGTLTTAPAVDLEKREVRFLVYADMGTSAAPGAATTVQRILKGPMRYKQAFVLHVGDISYAYGHGIVWEQFFNLIEPIATRIPYMVGIGNHEYDHTMDGQNDPSHAPGNGWHPSWGNFGDDSNGECGVPTYYRFHMPDNGNAVFWYSFNYALVHVVMISSEHNYTQGSPQYEWLKADLAAVNRTLTPWVVLGSHRPMYCSENYASDYKVSLHMRELLEDLLAQYKVDLVLTGHYHSYERTCPVYKGECMGDYNRPRAPVHVVLGMAGAYLDDATYMDVPWSRFHDQQFGYVQIRITNSTAMRLEYYHNTDGQLADSFWLHKRR